MREIKFRAWDKDKKEMFVPLMLDWTPSGIPISNPIQLWHQRSQVSDDGFWVDNFELMQFTGLIDKNGREIYEGDIIERRNELGNVVFRADIKFGEFRWWEEGAWHNEVGFYIVIDKEQSPIDYEELEKGRYDNVIGNIYENPELLNNKGDKN